MADATVVNSVYRLAGRIGGYARAARHDGRQMTAAARQRFTESFLEGHGCRVCPETTLPADLLLPERRRRAEALRREHYARVALRSAQVRRGNKKAATAGDTRRGGQEGESDGTAHPQPAA